MPSLHSLGLEVNPSKEPLSYPGTLVKESCLIVGSWLYPLKPRPSAPIPEWELDTVDGPLHQSLGSQRPTLDQALRLARSPLMAERFPVLAVGSNASPGQLTHKFTSGRQVSEVVPITLVRVRGIALGHSAHISKAGYVPYVPVVGNPTAERDLFILWLDAAQLERINETEPNYLPVTVGRDNPPALLETGERVEIFSLYRGRWGALRLTPDGPSIDATNQENILGILGSLAWFRLLVPESQEGTLATVTALAGDEQRRIQVRERIAAEGLTGNDGLALRGFVPVRYREAVSGSLS
ncbi:MAG TPA: hypothetical protein VHJ83_07840 [Micromonosporaceae bacterium]|nr:hypothetical protein [Micromonosporaceae bacterium]